MKKIILLLSCAILIANTVFAQGVRRSTFRVDAPSALAGYKIIDEISDQGTAPWGTSIDSIWEGIEVKHDPTNLDGCSTAGFGAGYFNGKFALIYRGDCEFGAKAYYAQQAGAVGVILVNNLLGVVGMGAGAQGALVTIPVVMVTKADGDAILNQLTLSNTVTVSLTGWRFDPIANPIDIGYMNDGVIFPQGRAMPKHETDGTTNENYRLFTGARAYNFSLDPWDTLFTVGRLTGPGGFSGDSIQYYYSAPVLDTDSVFYYIIDTINNALVGFDLNNAAVGQYTMTNEMYALPSVYSETGLNSTNNKWVYKFNITNNIYSKGEYDMSQHKPVANSYVALTAGEYEWGHLYYIRNPQYAADSSQCIIMRDIIQDSVFNGQLVTMKLYEWSDNNANNVMDDISEVTEIALGEYTMTANDVVPITGLPIKVKLQSSVSPGQDVKLLPGTYYWLTVYFNGLVTDAFGIGVDYFTNYTANRAYGLASQGAPLYSITNNQIFSGFNNSGVPALSMITKFSSGVNDLPVLAGKVSIYPNPAVNELNIDVQLDKLSSLVQYEVIDITGKVLHSFEKNNIKSDIHKININNFSNGTYFVKIKSEGGVQTEKFTVSH